MNYVLHLSGPPQESHADWMNRLAQLAGACRDIIKDGKVTDKEIEALKEWLAVAGQLKREWPANALSIRLRLDEEGEDREELKRLLKEIADNEQILSRHSCPECDQPAAPLEFAGKIYVLTGIFYAGSRAAMIRQLEERGATIRNAVTSQTDYLIVGGVSNPRWVQPDGGRKVLDARERRQGYDSGLKKHLASVKKALNGNAGKRFSFAYQFPKPWILHESVLVQALEGNSENYRGGLPGFHFHVADWYLDAVRLYGISEGSIFYEVPVCGDDWGTYLFRMKRIVQVQSAIPGRDGRVRFRLSEANETKDGLATLQEIETTQFGLLAFLWTGDVAGTIPVLSSKSEPER